MNHQCQTITILIAEDDPDDCVLIEQAYQESGLDFNLSFVRDGIELLQFLRQEPGYASPAISPRPDLILLDLKMPRMDGFSALAEIKEDANLRSIPVVVLTNLKTEQDVLRTYDLGGAGFIIKPDSFEGLVEVVKVVNQYWFEVVELTCVEHVEKQKRHLSPAGSSS
jgi:CheY-like chemotaxis protein